MTQSIPDAVLRGRRANVDRQPEVPMRRTQRETAVVLGRVPLFTDLSRRQLHRLAKETDELAFAPGERIVEEGNLGETLFVVLSGSGVVTRKGRKVGRVVPGDFFGELSALDGGPRTATIVAETPMRVLRLFRRTLAGLLRDEPQLSVKLLGGMARRIREVERRTG
ncbi:MAG TPA: cyclic nucleotide-binding domain-containing protein [Actinomycetota bacterium]|jgi:CRP-like cAMP-binding protein